MTTTENDKGLPNRPPDIANDRGRGWITENRPEPHRRSSQDPFDVIAEMADGRVFQPTYPQHSRYSAQQWINGLLGIKSAEQLDVERQEARKWEDLQALIKGGPKEGHDWRAIARLVLDKYEALEAKVRYLEADRKLRDSLDEARAAEHTRNTQLSSEGRSS